MLQGRPFRASRGRGMPLSGAADPLALAHANWLAGNAAETPAIETAYAPFSFRAACEMEIGICGATRQIKANGITQEPFRNIAVAAGDVIALSAAENGCRSYIAVNGGFAAETFLNGNSTYLPAKLGGSANMQITAAAKLHIAHQTTSIGPTRILPADYQLRHGAQFILRYIAGPEFDWMDQPNQQKLTQQQWRIGRRTDRMGIALEGDALHYDTARSMNSSAVFPGIIQCPPSGVPFLLGPDAQTTGGYPRIAQIIRADRHIIGQLKDSARLSLQKVKPAEAQRLYRSKLDILRKLQPEIQLD